MTPLRMPSQCPDHLRRWLCSAATDSNASALLARRRPELGYVVQVKSVLGMPRKAMVDLGLGSAAGGSAHPSRSTSPHRRSMLRHTGLDDALAALPSGRAFAAAASLVSDQSGSRRSSAASGPSGLNPVRRSHKQPGPRSSLGLDSGSTAGTKRRLGSRPRPGTAAQRLPPGVRIPSRRSTLRPATGAGVRPRRGPPLPQGRHGQGSEPGARRADTPHLDATALQEQLLSSDWLCRLDAVRALPALAAHLRRADGSPALGAAAALELADALAARLTDANQKVQLAALEAAVCSGLGGAGWAPWPAQGPPDGVSGSSCSGDAGKAQPGSGTSSSRRDSNDVNSRREADPECSSGPRKGARAPQQRGSEAPPACVTVLGALAASGVGAGAALLAAICRALDSNKFPVKQLACSALEDLLAGWASPTGAALAAVQAAATCRPGANSQRELLRWLGAAGRRDLAAAGSVRRVRTPATKPGQVAPRRGWSKT
jgi:hypothetical protein